MAFGRNPVCCHPDYELCIEQLDWWAECWPLQNGHYPPCAHDFGRNLVYHFHKAFNIMELTELVSVGRLNAQQWCRRHGQTWEEHQAGVDFFGAPFSYRYLEPTDCLLYHLEWTRGPYILLQEPEASGETTRVASPHDSPHTLDHFSCITHEHLAWDIAHKPRLFSPMPQAATQHNLSDTTGESSTCRSATNTAPHQATASNDHYDEDARQPLPQPSFDPPLPSGPAPTVTAAEAECVSFRSRKDFLRFLLLPGAFEAMLMAGRQPCWVWKNLPEY